MIKRRVVSRQVTERVEYPIEKSDYCNVSVIESPLISRICDQSLHNIIYWHEIDEILLIIFQFCPQLFHRKDIIHSVLHLLRVFRNKCQCDYVRTCPEGKMFYCIVPQRKCTPNCKRGNQNKEGN